MKSQNPPTLRAPSLEKGGGYLDINNDYDNVIEKTAEVINAGGLVVFPSDTVYILAVDSTNEKAVKKLLDFKNRVTGKAISVAVLNKKMAQDYVKLSENALNIYSNLLPGPFTIVSEGKHKVVKGIEAENGTLGVRIPDNKWIRDLITVTGKPITATSANLGGRVPNYTISSFLKTLSQKKKDLIDLIVDAGKLPKNKPSTVIDTTEPEIKVLRRGDLITGDTKTLISKSEKETEKIAEFILKKVIKNKGNKPIVLALTGDLGCGKTVFSRKIGKLLGVTDKIVSPTFVIYNEYSISPVRVDQNINKYLHFDIYRITDSFELEEIKFLDLFEKGTFSCVEWPENMGGKYLDKIRNRTRYISIAFEYVDQNSRKITW